MREQPTGPSCDKFNMNGRRYAISIEPIYWTCLEEAAETLNIRLNQLVSFLATRDTGTKNLAARLRLFCVHRLRRLVRQADMHTGDVDIAGLIGRRPNALLCDLWQWRNRPRKCATQSARQ